MSKSKTEGSEKFSRFKHMKIIVFEDRVYRVTASQFREIEQIAKLDDENAMMEHLEANQSTYRFVGYIHFTFRS